MINWYIPLYLGVILILFLFPHIGSFPNLQVYSEGRSGFGGLSTGTNLLLSRLISGDLLAFAIIYALLFGVMGGLAFAFTVLASLLIYVLIVYKLRKKKACQSIHDLLREQSDPYSYKYHLLVLCAINLGNMLLQLVALNYLLGPYFLQASYQIIFFIVVFSFIYSGLGGFEALNKGAKPQMIIVFFTTALITVSVFLEKGLSTTYQDLVIIPLNPISFSEWTIILLTGIIILTSQYLLDHSLWHCVYRLKPQRQYSILLIAIFCVFAISMGYSSITIYGMSQTILTGNNILQVLERNKSIILLNLYILTVFIAVSSSYALNLFSTVLLYFKFRETDHPVKETSPIKQGYIFSFLINLLVAAFFLLLLHNSLIEVISVLGIVYASLIVPYLITLFRTSPPLRFVAYSGVIPLICGVFIYLRFGYFYTPILCLGLSVVLQVIISLLRKMQEIIKTG
ncbi:hypothetical protein E4K67_23690 [Desulfosporosinus fructosivorans]|uniref:Uncharacterized protein n=1 Tax=Desulfosporosinus fructosivorans TaxID=2018669 RepID=A0A4Z0R197_9FIRM|nr:hypothetical protein [Desulfosporosinus fructosivorans]TGE35767.1 hypothetical protein E4K67_23690 [Desulfosporosinus fructosivorans]